ASGILLHPTSFPNAFGIGELGTEAFAFIDFLKEARQQYWQILPLNPTGYGDSPFQCFSAYAGNHLLLSLDKLRHQGLLERADFRDQPKFPKDWVDFGSVIPWKTRTLMKAASRFWNNAIGAERRQFDQFCADHSSWLPDFTLFMACKAEQDGAAWPHWPTE